MTHRAGKFQTGSPNRANSRFSHDDEYPGFTGGGDGFGVGGAGQSVLGVGGSVIHGTNEGGAVSGATFRNANCRGRSAFSRYKPSNPFSVETALNPVKVTLASAGLRSLYERISRPYDVKYVENAWEAWKIMKTLLEKTQQGSHFPDVLLFKRYLVTPKSDCVLSKDGLTCLVVRAEDVFCGNRSVAIKVYKQEFSSVLTQELETNRRISRNDPFKWANLLDVQDSFQFGRDSDSLQCAVMELMDPKPLFEHKTFDRMKHLRHNKEMPYSDKSALVAETLMDLRKITFEVLKTLGYLRWQRIIHADLKPENILLSLRGDEIDRVKVIDFGNAIEDCLDEKKLYFGDFQLQAILYRAPEVYFGLEDFSFPVDIWSLGCIISELFMGKPLFPFDEEVGVVSRMEEVLGPFPRELFRKGARYREFKRFVRGDPFTVYQRRETLQMELNTVDFHFVDFVQKCLTFDPRERINPEEAMTHPFLAPLVALGYCKAPREPRFDWCPYYARKIWSLEQRGNPVEGGDPEPVIQRSLRHLKDLSRSSAPAVFEFRSFPCQKVEVKAVPEVVKIESDEEDAEAVPMDLSEGEIADDGDVDRVNEDDEDGFQNVKNGSDVQAEALTSGSLTSEPEVLTSEPEVLTSEPEVLTSEPEVKAEDVLRLIPRHVAEELEGLEELAKEEVDEEEILDSRFEDCSLEDLPSPIPHADETHLDEAEPPSYSLDEYFTDGDDDGQVRDGPGKNTYHMHLRTEERIDPEFRSYTQFDGDVSSIPLPSYPSPFENRTSSAWNETNQTSPIVDSRLRSAPKFERDVAPVACTATAAAGEETNVIPADAATTPDHVVAEDVPVTKVDQSTSFEKNDAPVLRVATDAVNPVDVSATPVDVVAQGPVGTVKKAVQPLGEHETGSMIDALFSAKDAREGDYGGCDRPDEGKENQIDGGLGCGSKGEPVERLKQSGQEGTVFAHSEQNYGDERKDAKGDLGQWIKDDQLGTRKDSLKDAPCESPMPADLPDPLSNVHSREEVIPDSPHRPGGRIEVGNGLAEFDRFISELVSTAQDVAAARTDRYGAEGDAHDVSVGSLELKLQSDTSFFGQASDHFPARDKPGERDTGRSSPSWSPNTPVMSSDVVLSWDVPTTSSVEFRSAPGVDVGEEKLRADGTTMEAMSPGTSPNSSSQPIGKTFLTRQLDSLLEHKHRNLFEKAVKDKHAPNYSRIVKNPVDISKIKARIRAGKISNFAEVKRDVMLMFSNSIMFNSRRSLVHQDTLEMVGDVYQRLEEVDKNLRKIKAANQRTTFTSPIRKRRPATPNLTPASTPLRVSSLHNGTPGSARPTPKNIKKERI